MIGFSFGELAARTTRRADAQPLARESGMTLLSSGRVLSEISRGGLGVSRLEFSRDNRESLCCPLIENLRIPDERCLLSW